MANYNPSWKTEVGINNVASYQVSGRPFATGSIAPGTASVEIAFPYVTRWFQVINKCGNPLKVAFSHEGLNVEGTGSENYYLTVEASASTVYGKSEVYEMKVSSLWCVTSGTVLDGNNDFNVVAGLTTIEASRTESNFTGSYLGV